MVSFTVSTSKNWDSSDFVTRAGSDIYNISTGAVLTIDTDTRYCANSSAATAAIAQLNLNLGSGGSVYIDGSKVRIIPYNTGASNVPAINTVISIGGVSATLLGVWSAFNVAPTTAGSAMPPSGYIKVKNVTGGTFSAGALTGISATATGPDTVGWIEVIGVETGYASMYAPYSMTIAGQWFEHPTLVTTGTNTSTYQLPASLANTYYAGCWVETAASSGAYEFYPSAGSLISANSIATDAVRGKVCWITSQGLLTLGYDGTNTNGYLPGANRKIRVPNINLINAPVATPATNAAPNATLATRFRWSISHAVSISIDKANIAWNPVFLNTKSLSITNTAIHEQLSITRIQERITVNNVGIGQTAANSQTALILISCITGGDFTDVVATRATTVASSFLYQLTCIKDMVFTRCKGFHIAARSVATVYTFYCLDGDNITVTDCTMAIGSTYLGVVKNSTITNFTYFDCMYGTTILASFAQTAIIYSYVSNTVLNGYNHGGLAMVQPASIILSLTANNNNNLVIKNIGTSTAPLDMGGPVVNDVTWAHTAAALVATITSVGHGLKSGDYIFVNVSSDIAVVASLAYPRVITYVDADHFTIVVLGGAGTSGTMTYWPTVTNYFIATNAAQCNDHDITVQQCYVVHAKVNSGIITSPDNWRLNQYNVWSDTNIYVNPALWPQQDSQLKGIKFNTAWTNQGIYGTHWVDGWYQELSTNTSAQVWNRITSTCTVTSVAHNMRTGDSIDVKVSSDTGAVLLGIKQITAINSSTFSFPCTAGGASSGTLSYEPVDGLIAIMMNEPSVATARYVTIEAGTPHFASAGYVTSYNIGDQIMWEMQDYILGHTGFANVAPYSPDFPDRHIYTYQIDKNDGAGYSDWRLAHMALTATGGAAGAYTITFTAGVRAPVVGDYITGTGVTAGTKVVTVDSPTQVTVDVANVGTVSGVLQLRHQPGEVIDPARGFKLKFRMYSVIASGVSQMLFIYTKSTVASRAIQYPSGGTVVASTLWNPALGEAISVTPSGSATSYRGNVLNSKFPVQDPVSSSLSRYEYLVQYDDNPNSTTTTAPWHQLWTTVSGYVPVYSALSFVSSSAGNPTSGSITRLI